MLRRKVDGVGLRGGRESGLLSSMVPFAGLSHQLSHVDPWLSGPPAWASGPPSAVYLLDILRATWVGGTQPPGLRS